MNLSHRTPIGQLRAAALAPWLIAGVALGAGEAPVPPAAPGAGVLGPKIVCDEPVQHLGEVRRGDIAEATFVLRNAGDAPLRIDRVHPG